MPFQKLTNLLLVLSFSSFAFANDEKILSEDRLNLFKYSNEQNKESSQQLKKDWINPITLTYSKNYTETYDSSKSVISINQPIFKSGGIYKAIKYANASFKYNDLDIKLQKKELIKDVTTMLFNLHIFDLNISKNELLLKNAMIDIERKKEQALNGFLDTSTLDNAILDANQIKNTLAELKHQKNELNLSFSNLASRDYKNFELPALKLTDKESFMKSNLEVSKVKADIEQKDNFASMTIAKYLPTVSANFDYTKYHDTDNNPSITDTSTQNYGLSVSMPFDVRTFNDIQTQKIEYLKAKINLNNTLLEEENFYKTKISKLNMLDEKKKIANSDYDLYNSLLEVIIEEKNAELKTQSDVDILQNSQKIRSIDLKIYNLEEQIELLEIYSKII